MKKYTEIRNGSYLLRGIYEEGNQNKGLVVLFHGFTGHKNENNFLLKNLSKALALNGYSSLRFDFMGNGDSDGDFSEMTYNTILSDARTIINYALEINKTKKLIVGGFSMGGLIASRMGVEYSDKIDLLLLMSPAANMDEISDRYIYKSNLKWYNDTCKDMGGYLISKDFADSFKGINLYENVEKFTKPVQIIHGECDKSVPIIYSEKYLSLYKNVSRKLISNAEHCYQSMEQRQELMDTVINFLKENEKN